ncbi:MAG: hypothetical protein IKN96_09540 [Oscillibacter sp.]|nr:hypothetical protein [Oscillibacter sp.]
MDLLNVASANQHAKNMARRTQWELKKQSRDFSGHKKSLQDYVNITKASSVLPQADEEDTKMSAIMTKAQAGKKLSYDDWEYLKAKNPAMYEKLRAAEKEQKDYEEALKRCKTRDEARRLHMSKLGEIMSAAKDGDESALVRLNRMTRTMVEFTKSDEYRDMPTEAEQAIERESERQAEREILRAETETEREALRADTEAADAGRKAAQGEPGAESVPKDGESAKPEAKAKAEAVPKKKAAVREAQGVRISGAAIGAASAHGAAPFGRRAYLLRQDGEPRRKVFEAQA